MPCRVLPRHENSPKTPIYCDFVRKYTLDTHRNAGQQLPCGYTLRDYDTYTYGDYIYTYQTSSNGWKVAINEAVTDRNQTEYGAILESINSEPVTSMYATFRNCISLVNASVIPSSVTDMSCVFEGCTSLITAPVIPNSVTGMYCTFQNCTSLVTAPAIPSSVTNMQQTFRGCTSLITAPVIPNSVTTMQSTLQNCTSLVTAPAIPSSVTNMQNTFYGCTALTTAPVIPTSVTNMTYTFAACTSLTGTIEINATNLTSYSSCFSYIQQSITLTGTCSQLSELANGRSNIIIQQ